PRSVWVVRSASGRVAPNEPSPRSVSNSPSTRTPVRSCPIRPCRRTSPAPDPARRDCYARIRICPARGQHGCVAGQHETREPIVPTKLVVDTAPGGDDAFAIALGACSPEVELLGVTTVFGNVAQHKTTHNARGLLTLCDRPDVPV